MVTQSIFVAKQLPDIPDTPPLPDVPDMPPLPTPPDTPSSGSDD